MFNVRACPQLRIGGQRDWRPSVSGIIPINLAGVGAVLMIYLEYVDKGLTIHGGSKKLSKHERSTYGMHDPSQRIIQIMLLYMGLFETSIPLNALDNHQRPH